MNDAPPETELAKLPLPMNWARIKIADLMPEFQNGESSRGQAGSLPTVVLRLADIVDGKVSLENVRRLPLPVSSLKKYSLEPGDILVIRVNGSTKIVGRFVLPDVDNVIYCDHFIRMRVSSELVNPGYLTLLASSSLVRSQIERSFVSTAGQKTINQRHIKSITIPLPPRLEQERIVAAIDEQFSRIDAGVAALKRTRQNLARILATLTAMAEIEDGSRGERMTLGDIATIDSGPAFSSAKFKGPGQGIKLLRGENIEPGALRWNKTRTWPTEELPGYEHLFVDKDDLILAMDRPIVSAGLKLASVRLDDLPALLVQRVARIRPRNVNPRFLHIALMSRRFAPHLLRSQTGTQLPHITLAGIRSFPLAVPPPYRQVQVVQEFDRLSMYVRDSQAAVTSAEIRAALLRKAILVAAFSGKLVPQGFGDEPAAALLERIATESAASDGNEPVCTHKPRTLREKA